MIKVGCVSLLRLHRDRTRRQSVLESQSPMYLASGEITGEWV